MDQRHRDLLGAGLDAAAKLLVATTLVGLVAVIVLAFSFGAADQEVVAIRAEPLTADEVVADATVELDAAGQAVVAEAIANGSAQTVAPDEDSVFDEAAWYRVHEDAGLEFIYVEYNGSFYQFTVTNTSQVEVMTPTLGVVPVNRTDERVIDYRSISGVDQQRFREALRLRQTTDCDPTATGPNAPRCWSVYEPDEVADSAFVPSPLADYVRYRNRTYRLVVRQRPVGTPALSYAATRLTSDPGRFRDRLVTDVEPATLDDREREMFEAAVDDEFRVGQSRRDLGSFPEERVDGLLTKLGLPSIDTLRPGHQGRAVSYVRLGDTYYRIVVEYYNTYT